MYSDTPAELCLLTSRNKANVDCSSRDRSMHYKGLLYNSKKDKLQVHSTAWTNNTDALCRHSQTTTVKHFCVIRRTVFQGDHNQFTAQIKLKDGAWKENQGGFLDHVPFLGLGAILHSHVHFPMCVLNFKHICVKCKDFCCFKNVLSFCN